jgi:penicillin-binding protein 1A
MSLGAGETTPLRMATAYAELVNGGKEVRPVMLDRIQNRYGETVYKSDQRECPGCKAEWTPGLQPPALEDKRKQLMDPVVAYQIVSILQGAVEHRWGTVRTALSVGKPVGGKTGTTNDYTNAWTVGFSPDLVAAIYIGPDMGKMAEGSSGGVVASPVFRDFMMAALKDQPALPFRVPSDVEFVEIDMHTGCLPTANTTEPILEAFKPGTAPTESCAEGGSTEGFKVDYSNILAGDEAPSTMPTQTPTTPPPGSEVPLAPGQLPGQPADPNQSPVQERQQPQQNDQTIKSPVF